MLHCSNEESDYQPVLLKTLSGDLIQADTQRMEKAAKEYFQTPYDEDIHYVSLPMVDETRMMLMMYVPFHTRVQTYIKIRSIESKTHEVMYRILDPTGRVYLEKCYRIKIIYSPCTNVGAIAPWSPARNKVFVWVNPQNTELSPVMSTIDSLADYLAAQRSLSPEPEDTAYAIAAEREFLTTRLKVEWKRYMMHHEFMFEMCALRVANLLFGIMDDPP